MDTPITPPTPAHTTSATKTILILEDSQAIRDTIVTILEFMGFKTISAVASLAEARLLAGKIPYDIYVSDCNLGEQPGQENGRDFLLEIARMSPNSARLFISGNAQNFVGFAGETLVKPFPEADFIRALNRALIASGQEPFSIS